jgi:DNA-binding SARP family transcriptional activator
LPAHDVTIELCGQLAIVVDGRRRESALPARQGRLALAYVALQHPRPVTRDGLIAALWGDDAPMARGQGLAVVLSRLRRALGPDVLVTAGDATVALCAGTHVDLADAERQLADMLGAKERSDWVTVLLAAQRLVALDDRRLLPGYDAPWLDEARRRLEDVALQAYEAMAEGGVALGGAELSAAEQAANALVERAPFRESGHLLLMQVWEAKGDVAAALGIYDRLCELLRDELGVPPGPRVQAHVDELRRHGLHHGGAPQPLRSAPAAAARDAPERSFFATRSRAMFVGRRHELRSLERYFRESAGGQRQLVLVEGEPGIGKTRLAIQFAELCEAQGAVTLYGRCDAESLIPYQPFGEALRRYTARASPERLATWLDAHGGELAKVIPGMVTPTVESAPIGAESEGADRYRVFEAVSQILTDIARTQPVVLVLDDLHWADKATLLMLRQIFRSAQPAPLLVVGCYRDTERPELLADTLVALRREHFFERVSLGGLDEPDAEALIEDVGRRQLAPRLNRVLWEETRGNPFFLEEMLRHVERDGASAQEDEAPWSVDRRLPEGIREVIERRLAGLSEQANRVLAVAAVIGREFPLKLLENVARVEQEAFDAILLDAVATQVVIELPGSRSSFTHSLIRQTLYEGLTETRRARVHLSVAEALEQFAGDQGEPPLAELAYHFFRAPPPQGAAKAVEYAERAASHASALLAHEEAVRLCQMALQALHHVGDDPRRRYRLLMRLGDAQTKANEARDARASYRRAGEIARALGRPEDLGWAALGYGTIGQMAGGVVDRVVVELLEEALAQVSEDDSVVRARLLARLATELSFSGQLGRRAALSAEAVEIATRLDHVGALGHALVARHWSLWGPENVAERLGAANDLLELAERSGDQHLAIQGHQWRMIDLLEIGDIGEVDIEIAAYARLVAERQQLHRVWYVHLLKAMRMLLAGDFAGVQSVSAEALRLGLPFHDTNAMQGHALQMVALGRELGGLEEIEEVVRTHVERFPAIPGWRCVLLHLQVELGRLDEARRGLDELAGEGFRDLPYDGIWLGAVALLAEAAAALGDAGTAHTLYGLLLPFAERNVAIGWASTCAGSASRHLGLLACAMARRDDAARHFEAAIAMNEHMGAHPWVARTQVEYAQMLLRNPDLSTQERAAKLLETGLAEARRLGMRRLIAQGSRLAAARAGA